MTEDQKHFLAVTLPEFILREEGRGFAMEHWISKHWEPGAFAAFDGLERVVPSCGTVCCIGGSTDFLQEGGKYRPWQETAAALGLSAEEGEALFFGWERLDKRIHYVWPESFRSRFADADTPLEKAEVAAELLRLVSSTEGRCLRRGYYVEEAE